MKSTPAGVTSAPFRSITRKCLSTSTRARPALNGNVFPAYRAGTTRAPVRSA